MSTCTSCKGVKVAKERSLAAEAVARAAEAQCRKEMDSSWTSVLVNELNPLAQEDPQLEELLRSFGWTGTQFQSPPDLDKLAAALARKAEKVAKPSKPEMKTLEQ